MSLSRWIATELATAGFIPILPSTLPLQEILYVADALLASPVFAVVVSGNEPTMIEAVTKDLYRRSDGAFLVGTINTPTDNGLPPTQLSFFKQTDSEMMQLKIPVVRNSVQAKTMHWQERIAVTHTADLDNFKTITNIAQDKIWLVLAQLNPKALPVWQAAGMRGLLAPIWHDTTQTMTETIKIARSYNRHFHDDWI